MTGAGVARAVVTGCREWGAVTAAGYGDGVALILSLVLDTDAQRRLDDLRSAHFPADRLVVGAHVTLFHALPDAPEPRIRADVLRIALRGPFEVRIAGVRSLGRGVALVLDAAPLLAVRAELADAWRPWLTPQDAHSFSPHVTVQNKVTPEVARLLLQQMSAAFEPWTAQARGLALWRYLGGPWGHLSTEEFSTDVPGGP